MHSFPGIIGEILIVTSLSRIVAKAVLEACVAPASQKCQKHTILANNHKNFLYTYLSSYIIHFFSLHIFVIFPNILLLHQYYHVLLL